MPRRSTATLRGMTAAINLVGILHERGRDTFERAHVELPRALATACRAAGVARILHMSALGADAGRAEPLTCARRRKAKRRSLASGLASTIFRPSVIFGREDTFLNLFARLARWFPVIPLAGANARFQPVHVGDVATCFVRALDDNETIGQRYDAVRTEGLHAVGARALRRAKRPAIRVR